MYARAGLAASSAYFARSIPILAGLMLTGPLGEGGIRTHGTLITFSGFQDRRIQPLCHLSKFTLGHEPADLSGIYFNFLHVRPPTRDVPSSNLYFTVTPKTPLENDVRK